MHVLLKSLIPIAETIGKTFGNRCEVVLHDLTIPEKSVVYTVNGDVTGRREGQTFDRLVRSVLLNKNFTPRSIIPLRRRTAEGSSPPPLWCGTRRGKWLECSASITISRL